MSKRAICIGINNYPGTDSDLSGCVNDARDWAKVLKERDFSVQTLIDKQATGKAMREAIADLISQAKPRDTVLVQYSGHGSFVPDEDGDEPDGTDECLCPYDIRSQGPITDDELFDLFSARAQGVKAVMIADSCHSGTVSRFAPISTPFPVKGRRVVLESVRFLPPANFLSRIDAAKLGLRRRIRSSNPPGRYAALLVAGCQDTEYSYDAYFQGRPNGAFSFVALRCLKALSAKATYRDWFKAIREVLPSRQYPQTPNLFGSSSQKRWKALG